MRRPATLAVLVLLPLLAACEREPTPVPARAVPGAPTAAAAPAAAPEPAQPAARVAAPDWGEPDMPKVRKLFASRFSEVKRCYEAELQKYPEARGKLTLRFTIAETGALRSVTVPRSSFERRDVPSCIVEVVRRWSTPFRPAEPVEVEYPFSFSPR